MPWVYHLLACGVTCPQLNRATWCYRYLRCRARSCTHLREFEIPVPCNWESNSAIVAVLDSIDEAIKRTEAVIAATERLRDALLHELLTHGVPSWHSAVEGSPRHRHHPSELGGCASWGSRRGKPKASQIERGA